MNLFNSCSFLIPSAERDQSGYLLSERSEFHIQMAAAGAIGFDADFDVSKFGQIRVSRMPKISAVFFLVIYCANWYPELTK